jgi:protein pelota
MRLLKLDKKNHLIEVIPETFDDLWHLERVIETGDLVSGKSERKIKGTEGKETKKVSVFAEVKAEKIELHQASKQLRVSGPLTFMKPEEFFEAGAFHCIEAEKGKKIKIKKKRLKNHQIERIQRAVKESRKERVLLLVLDDEIASLALVKGYGLEKKGEIRSGIQGKRYEPQKGQKEKFFSELLEKIKQIEFERLVIAGPGFTKTELNEFIKQKNLSINAVVQNTNSVGETGLNELISSGILEKIMQENRLSKENRLMEHVLKEIGRDSGLIAYGEKEVMNAVKAGAVSELLVSDKKLFEERKKIEELMEETENLGGKVHVLSSENDAGKKLDGFGGIIAFLRFKMYE